MTLAMLLLLVCAAPAQEPLEAGSRVPPLSGEDVAGRALAWGDFAEKVVLVFFHSEQMAYSTQGLQRLLDALAADHELVKHVEILLVGTGQVDAASAAKSFDAARVRGRVVADPDRSRFAAYRVVAFPTVFTVDPDRDLRTVVKGFGPLMTLKVVSSARLAAGLIDEGEYHRALESQPEVERSSEQLRIARNVRMVRQLLAAGMLDQARESMLRVLDLETEHAEGVALLVRILLLQGRADDARPWMARLEELTPTAVEVRRLRAHLALLEGRPDVALSHLEELPEDDPEAALLRGKAWEAKGDPAKAAALYRRALETLLRERG